MQGCAGRDPVPIATVQPQDQTATCTGLTAEIEANNIKFKDLSDEQGLKVGQNVAAGVVGLAIPVLWFAMDFKGAADFATIRGFLSTARKQGWNIIKALQQHPGDLEKALRAA